MRDRRQFVPRIRRLDRERPDRQDRLSRRSLWRAGQLDHMPCPQRGRRDLGAHFVIRPSALRPVALGGAAVLVGAEHVMHIRDGAAHLLGFEKNVVQVRLAVGDADDLRRRTARGQLTTPAESGQPAKTLLGLEGLLRPPSLRLGEAFRGPVEALGGQHPQRPALRRHGQIDMLIESALRRRAQTLLIPRGMRREVQGGGILQDEHRRLLTDAAVRRRHVGCENLLGGDLRVAEAAISRLRVSPAGPGGVAAGFAISRQGCDDLVAPPIQPPVSRIDPVQLLCNPCAQHRASHKMAVADTSARRGAKLVPMSRILAETCV